MCNIKSPTLLKSELSCPFFLLTNEDPQQRPHDDHHHKHHGCDDDSEVRDVQQISQQPLESLGLPSGLSVLPADLLQSVVDRGHLHRHICDLQPGGGDTFVL